jgi:hypothetical protein
MIAVARLISGKALPQGLLLSAVEKRLRRQRCRRAVGVCDRFDLANASGKSYTVDGGWHVDFSRAAFGNRRWDRLAFTLPSTGGHYRLMKSYYDRNNH